jgi:hypothetical protein
MNELRATGRAIAPELRTAWLEALRTDLRRAVRNMVRLVSARRVSVKRVDVQV